jgi:hypothetical protein
VPQDGTVVSLQVDAANGIDWLLRYNASSASAYKWEFLGGPPLTAGIATEETATGPFDNWQDLPTVGPQVAVLRAGEYPCRGSAYQRHDAYWLAAGATTPATDADLLEQ